MHIDTYVFVYVYYIQYIYTHQVQRLIPGTRLEFLAAASGGGFCFPLQDVPGAASAAVLQLFRKDPISTYVGNTHRNHKRNS